MEILVNIAQRLVDGAIHETSYLCCFSCIAKEFENEKDDLKPKLKSVQERAEVATRQGEEILSDIKHWMEKADHLIEVDTKTKKSCFFGLFPDCIWHYRKGKELQKNVQDIKKLLDYNLDKISRPIEPPGMEYYSSRDFISLESRKLAYAQLEKELKDGNTYMVGLQGMGGSGKTTLAKEVGKEVQKSKIFDKAVFSVISNPPNVRKIQDDIASAQGLLLNGNESKRRKKLWSRIKNEKKILIILDDVWEKLNFEDIGIPSRDNHKGCCILLTTRDSKVCNLMECQKIINLKLLLEEDAWILFQKFANINDNSPLTLKDVAQKITSECKGLPIAIVAMASTLKGHPLEDWRAALITLQSSKPIDNIHEDLKHVYHN